MLLDAGNKWRPEWMCIIWHGLGHFKGSMPQTHRVAKLFLDEEQRDGKTFLYISTASVDSVHRKCLS